MGATPLFPRQLVVNAVLDSSLIPHPQSPMAHEFAELFGLGLDDVNLVQHALGAHLRQPSGITTIRLGPACRHGPRACRVYHMNLMSLFLNPTSEPPSRAAHLHEHIRSCRYRFPKCVPLGRMQLERTKAAFSTIDLVTQCRVPQMQIHSDRTGHDVLLRHRLPHSTPKKLLIESRFNTALISHLPLPFFDFEQLKMLGMLWNRLTLCESRQSTPCGEV